MIDTTAGDRLFAGTSSGNLQIHQLIENENSTVQSELITSKNLGRRTIEQIDYCKDINSLIVLSGACSAHTFILLVLTAGTA